MQKFIASAGLVVVFGLYIAYKNLGGDDNAIAVTPPAISQQSASATPLTPQSSSDPYAGVNFSQDMTSNSYPSSAPDYAYQASSTPPSYVQQQSSQPVYTQQQSSVPPPPPPPPARSSAAAQGQYKDGTYTGVAADAFYGNIQVAVTVSGGKISDVQFLQYPNDRGTSIMINSQAMPYLRQEAIQAQSAPVDIVSGATDSSGAFNQSLASALNQARNS